MIHALFTDTSGSEGWGAYWSSRWLKDQWSPEQPKMNITWRNCMHLSWQCTHGVSHGSMHQKILFKCDNLTVVDIWAKGSTKSPEVMALVCIIFVLHVITLMLVFNISLVVKTKLFMPFHFSGHLFQGIGSRCRGNTNQHSCMASTSL